MATIDWPAGLPQALDVDGYAQSAADNFLRTPMDAGPAKVRRRFSSGPRSVSGSITVTVAQLATFKTFFVTTLLSGALRFDWVDPDDNVTAVEMRFVSPPKWEPVNQSVTRIRIEMDLEILP